ncbi:hypothetical protein OSTOST_06186, partial [Ostertagia ostertagi]
MSEDSGNELYQHWVDQAFSSLMAALATDRIPKVSSAEKERHYKCAKDADDVQSHARCVATLLEAGAEEAKRIRWMKLLGKKRVKNRVIRLDLNSYGSRPVSGRGFKLKKSTVKKKLRRKGVTLAVRRKREVLTMNSYNLIDKNNRIPKVSSAEKERHYKCAKDADDVQSHARCVATLLEAGAEEAKRIRWMKLLGKKRVKNR